MKYHAIQRLEIIEAGEFSMQNLGQFNVQLNTPGIRSRRLGGSFSFADPERKLGLAYTMNRKGTALVGDPRNQALIDAIYR